MFINYFPLHFNDICCFPQVSYKNHQLFIIINKLLPKQIALMLFEYSNPFRFAVSIYSYIEYYKFSINAWYARWSVF